jgi:hypothetical protein
MEKAHKTRDEQVKGSSGVMDFLRVLLYNTMVISSARNVPGIDQFLEAMGNPATHQQMWLVAANDIYVSCFHTLENNILDGVTLLVKAFMCTSLNTEARKKYHQAFPDKGSVSICKWLRLVFTQLQAAKESFDIDTSAFDNGDTSSPEYSVQRKQKQTILKNPWISGFETKLPPHAGSSLYTLQTTLMFRGCQTGDGDLVLHSMAYLYKAARHSGLLTIVWSEMDFFIASQAAVGPALIPKLKAKAKLNDDIFLNFRKAVGCMFKSKARRGRTNVMDIDLEKRGTPIKVGAPRLSPRSCLTTLAASRMWRLVDIVPQEIDAG